VKVVESPEEYRRVRFGNETISYGLTFSSRARLSISVHPDSRVSVVAPAGRSVEDVDARVRARAAWILAQRRRFERYQPLPVARRFITGESHRYLGRQYRLAVIRGEERVRLAGPYLHVALANPPDAAHVESLLYAWYRERALATFQRRVEALIRTVPSLGRGLLAIKVRRMTRRWGSCTKAGLITLNVELVKAPISCIDYVIVHELCHRLVMSHGPQFYRVLSRHMPDWERRRERLNMIVG